MSPLIKVTRSFNGWMVARSESHCMQLHAIIIDNNNGAQRYITSQRRRWRQWQLHLMREPLFVDAVERKPWNRQNETRAMWTRSHTTKTQPTNQRLTHAVQKIFSQHLSVFTTSSGWVEVSSVCACHSFVLRENCNWTQTAWQVTQYVSTFNSWYHSVSWV